MNDHELLKLAAAAAGVPGGWVEQNRTFHIAEHLRGPSDDARASREALGLAHGRAWWDPLTDDGDALRLAVKAGIAFRYERNAPPELHLPRECAIAITGNGRYFSDVAKDEMTATRRAIVRAAAAIGEALTTEPQSPRPAPGSTAR